MYGFVTFEPNLGASSTEPCLKDILFRYYSAHFDDAKALLLSQQYIMALIEEFKVERR